MLDTSTIKRYKSIKKSGFWHNIANYWTLIVGLGITGKNFTLPVVTVRYPWKTVEGRALATYRGHIELVPKGDNSTQPKCIMCGMCAKICPSGCLDLTVSKSTIGEVTTSKIVKTLKRFIYTYHLCSLCGLCVQGCPVGSIRFSGNVYLSGLNRATFEIDLLARLRDQIKAASSGVAAAHISPYSRKSVLAQGS